MIGRHECVRCGGDVYWSANWYWANGRRCKAQHWRVGQPYRNGRGWIHDRCIRKPQRTKVRRSPFAGMTDKDLVEWANGPEYDEHGYRTFIRLFGFCGMTNGRKIRTRLKRRGWLDPIIEPRWTTQTCINKRRARRLRWPRAKANVISIT